MSLVFDVSALVAQVKRERGARTADRLLADASQPRLVHAVNLCEVYYHLLRKGGERRAERTVRRLARAGLEAREDMDQTFWQAVAHLKADLQHA